MRPDRLLAPLAALLLAAAPAPDIPALLDRLKAAPGTAEAQRLEQALAEAWYAQCSPAVQILLDSALGKTHAGKPADALEDIDAAVALQPELVEPRRRRAQIRIATGDDAGALADLAQVFAREPRMVPAWADVSRLAEGRKDYRKALAAWRKLLELDPHAPEGAERLRRLQHKVEGRPI